MTETVYHDELFVSWDEIQALCTQMAAEILKHNLRRERILAITRGGLFPAGLLARELDIRMIETIGIMAYSGQQVFAPRLLKQAAPEYLENTLIIDDLVDTGATLDLLRPQTSFCTFATIFAKPKGRPAVDLFARAVPQETWIRFPWDTRRQFAEPLVRGR